MKKNLKILEQKISKFFEKNFKFLKKKISKIFWKNSENFLKNISKVFEKNLKNFWKKISKFFEKNLKIVWKKSQNFWKKFRKFFTGATSSGHLLKKSYNSAEMQLVHSTAPADWTVFTFELKFLSKVTKLKVHSEQNF